MHYHCSPRTYLTPLTAELELQPPQGKSGLPTSLLLATVLLPLFHSTIRLFDYPTT